MIPLGEALAELEHALDAQTAALSSADPAGLERSNAALAQSLSALRRLVRAPDGGVAIPGPSPDTARTLQRMKRRLEAQAALTARAASENRRALEAIGFDAQRLAQPAAGDKSAPGGQPAARPVTHLLA